MTSASKVGEIFSAAGTAFSRLGELTMQLHPIEEPNQTSTQMKTQLKKRAYEEAGIEIPTDSSAKSPKAGTSGKSQKKTSEGKMKSPSQVTTKKQKAGGDVTLTTLNASESEVDIETIGEQPTLKKVKLEFDSDLDAGGL